MSGETWRVDLATGEVREVLELRVERIAHGRLAHWWHVVGTTPAGGGTMPACATPHGAVLGAMWTHGWMVREILAPGEPTRAEAIEAARREGAEAMREALVRACQRRVEEHDETADAEDDEDAYARWKEASTITRIAAALPLPGEVTP